MSRTSGNQTREFDATQSVWKYGMFMGGVDTFDRYLSRFSIAKKLGLAVLQDLALNAFFSWRLAKGISNSTGANARDAHMDFLSNFIRELFTTKWEEYEDDSVLISNDLTSIYADTESTRNFNASIASPSVIAQPKLHCSPISGILNSNSSGRDCKVCWYELRPKNFIL